MTEYHMIYCPFKRYQKTKKPVFGDRTLYEFANLAECQWDWTEKIDGTNVRVIVSEDGSVEFRGRTDAAMMPPKLLRRLGELFADRDKIARVLPIGAVLYGEGYGAGIQKVGGLYGPTQDFILFDARIGRDRTWGTRESVEGIASALGINVVPWVGRGTLYEAIDHVAVRQRSKIGNILAFAEGIVARPVTDLCTRHGQRIICKIKAVDFCA
jgi:hypothetical protein